MDLSIIRDMVQKCIWRTVRATCPEEPAKQGKKPVTTSPGFLGVTEQGFLQKTLRMPRPCFAGFCGLVILTARNLHFCTGRPTTLQAGNRNTESKKPMA